ncbi:hypothetical protein RRF57_002836 [Xylaria bambusicola]|uniref:Apple domain-containing protein n=1 Tax=Xylaria bambusicola TaxID=326684 RepID=A0AAN7UJA7_9PEZI
MATEQQPPVLASPREPRQASPRIQEPGEPGPSQPVEFRGFDFFAQRDFNEYKDASRAYFAEKNGNPSSWLGDATPPASAHPSLDESRPEEIRQPSNEREQKDAKTILGLRRSWFWAILAIIIVIVIVAVGVGVGVGVTRDGNSTKNASGAGSAYVAICQLMSKCVHLLAHSSDAAETTETNMDIPATGTGMAPTSSPSTSTYITTTSTQNPIPTQGAKTDCPKVNGTVYEVPGSTKKFLQLCGIDYGKEDGAVDLRNVYTDTAEDCINNCAGTAGCTGCGWGFIEGDHGPPFRCWLKSKVGGRPHNADMTWHFSVLL